MVALCYVTIVTGQNVEDCDNDNDSENTWSPHPSLKPGTFVEPVTLEWKRNVNY